MFRRGGILRIFLWVAVSGVVLMVLFVVMLRLGDEDGQYQAVTKKAQDTYKSLAGTGSQEEPTLPGDEQDQFEVEPTVAESVIENPSLGMDVPALQLLPGRLTQELPIQHLSQKEEAALAQGVRAFLKEWETFTVNDQTYTRRIGRIVPDDGARRIAGRDDSRQADGVGPCAECTSGSRLQIESLDPGVYMNIHGYDGEWAYITTEGIIELEGAEGIPARWRRSYALIMTPYAGRWAVARAIAETKGVESR